MKNMKRRRAQPRTRALTAAVAIVIGVLTLLGLVIGNANDAARTPAAMQKMMQGMGGMMGGMDMGDMGKMMESMGMDAEEMTEHMEECHAAMASGDPQKMMDVMQKHMSDGHMDKMMQGMGGMMGGAEGMDPAVHASHHPSTT